MKCPIDGTELVITDRQGVEIDYCPQCRGVWLDRGELDKIIERADKFDNRDRDNRDRDNRDRDNRDRDNRDRDNRDRDNRDRDNRDRSRDDGDDDSRRRPSSNSGGVAGIVGMVGEVLKDKGGRSDERYRDEPYRGDSYDSRRKKKKGGILGELFDF